MSGSTDPAAMEVANVPSALATTALSVWAMWANGPFAAACFLLLFVCADVMLGVAGVAGLLGFAVGFASDLVLNAYFRGARAKTVRGREMRAYFDRSGWFTAALLAGAVTALMTETTFALAAALGLRAPTLEAGVPQLRDAPAIAGVGLVVAAVLGLATQYSPGLAQLLPFYLSTSGAFENHILYGGLSQVWATVWVMAIAVWVPPP